jgi:fructose-bisphosphate aldolase class II
MVKVNIGTILNVAWTSAVRDVLEADPAMIDPRKYLRPARDAVSDVVARLCGVIGRSS